MPDPPQVAAAPPWARAGRAVARRALAGPAARAARRALLRRGIELRRVPPADAVLPADAVPPGEPGPPADPGPPVTAPSAEIADPVEPPAPDPSAAGANPAAPLSTDPSSIDPLSIDPLSTDPLWDDHHLRLAFASAAEPIVERHRRQSAELVEALRRRYAGPLIGRVRVWDLVERLGACVDPSDQRLYGASQLMHVRLMLDAMEGDGVLTTELAVVTLVHDLGKLLLLTDEDPANVVCMNGPVGTWPAGAGLEHCMLQWNHDEFAYDRLRDHLPEDLAWLVRYHSLELDETEHLMDATDRERCERLLRPFAHYDHATKTPLRLPATPLSAYRDLIEDAFPHPVDF